MNRYYPHTIIAQEGWTFIIGGVVVSVIIMLLCGWWSLPFWLATLFMLNFFRDPARNIPEAPDAILSPADGRVVVVEKAIDPYRNIESLKISVFMNVFDVHSQRAPARGKITDVRYTAGSKINAALDKASSENERNAVLMTTASGREITFVQIAGLVARRILCYVNKGDSLVRGERYGFIRFGSRVDVYLPLDANPNVAIGDKVRATETILAFLPLEQDPNFDPSKVQIQSSLNNSPAARLKADKQSHAHDDLEAQIRERVAAQFQNDMPPVADNKIAKEESEVAARLAKIQAERQAEAAERERILAQEAAEAEEVRQRIAKEEAEEKAKAEAERVAKEQARLQAEQAAKAEAERVAQEQARLQAEQAAKAEAERVAQEQARLQAEQAAAQAKAEAERIAAEQQARAAEQARIQAAEQARAHAERLAEQARLEAERVAQEQARLQAEQAAKAEAERVAQEQARLQAEQAARAEAERVAQEQARLQAEQAARAEAERVAQEQARLQAEQAAKAEAERVAQAQAAQTNSSFRRAEEKALAEIAAREPIVRRESFASVPEPWQTVEPSEVVIKVEDK